VVLCLQAWQSVLTVEYWSSPRFAQETKEPFVWDKDERHLP